MGSIMPWTESPPADLADWSGAFWPGLRCIFCSTAGIVSPLRAGVCTECESGILLPVLKISDIWGKCLMKTRLWKAHLCGKKSIGIGAFPGGSRRLGCVLCHQACCMLAGVRGVWDLPGREVLTCHCFPLVGLLWLISTDGNSVWNGAENVLILLVFSFPSPLMGAMLPAPHNRQCPMEDVPVSLFPMAFYHSLILLIWASLKPRVWLFFSARWNGTWKHFNQCRSLKPLFIHAGKALSWYADNDWLYYVYLLAVYPSAIDSVSRFPGARFHFQPQWVERAVVFPCHAVACPGQPMISGVNTRRSKINM